MHGPLVAARLEEHGSSQAWEVQERQVRLHHVQAAQEPRVQGLSLLPDTAGEAC